MKILKQVSKFVNLNHIGQFAATLAVIFYVLQINGLIQCQESEISNAQKYLATHYAPWMLLGMHAGPKSAFRNSVEMDMNAFKDECRTTSLLDSKQQEYICNFDQKVLHVLGKGARMAIQECQHQFHMNRWNCTTFETPEARLFGGIMDSESREKAYIYAIGAAGAAYSLTKACSRGELTDCGCDDKIRNKDTKGKFQWGGCSDDIRYGAQFTKEFIDAVEDPESPEGLMNLHNNEAGRRTLRSNMELLCKCHGVSGSCTLRICWRKLKEFRQIGDLLRRNFESATLVRVVKRKNKTILKPARKDVKRPSKKDLVFLDDSMDYCMKNDSSGVLGTRGRVCNETSYGMDGCKLLCCGRGYQTVIREVEEKCKCKFVWCCKVECEKCLVKKEQHICN